MDKFENLFNALKKAQSDIEKKLKGLGIQGNDSEKIESLEAALRQLRHDFDQHA